MTASVCFFVCLFVYFVLGFFLQPVLTLVVTSALYVYIALIAVGLCDSDRLFNNVAKAMTVEAFSALLKRIFNTSLRCARLQTSLRNKT